MENDGFTSSAGGARHESSTGRNLPITPAPSQRMTITVGALSGFCPVSPRYMPTA